MYFLSSFLGPRSINHFRVFRFTAVLATLGIELLYIKLLSLSAYLNIFPVINYRASLSEINDFSY